MRTTVSISCGGRREHLAVNGGGSATKGTFGWYLQWAYPPPAGHRFGPPVSGPHKTKREANAARLAMLAPSPAKE